MCIRDRYRIGYLISSEEIVNTLTKLQALCLTNVSEPIQFVAMNSMNEDVSSNSELIHERLEVLVDICKKMNLEFYTPDGSMYVFAKIKNRQDNTTDLSHKLLENGLAIAPGEAFGDYSEFFRLSACIEKDSIIEGLNILSVELNK